MTGDSSCVDEILKVRLILLTNAVDGSLSSNIWRPSSV